MRRFFMLLSALSLLLCVGICVLWVRSYWHTVEIEFQRNGMRWSIAVTHGRIALSNEAQKRMLYAELVAILDEVKLAGEKNEPGDRMDGLMNKFNVVDKQIDSFVLVERKCAYVIPSSIFAILPIAWGALSLRTHLTRRRLHGFCHYCGYDLHATPDRCPECGTVPTN
jgi:hypothetical protein